MTQSFRFAARDAQGKERRGVLDAEHLADARQRLDGRGWTPIRVEPAVLPKPRSTPGAPRSSGSPLARTAVRALLLLLLLAVLAWAFQEHLRQFIPAA